MPAQEPRLGAELRTRIAAWREQDPDTATGLALGDLLLKADGGDAAATAELVDAFSGPLTFGTAGLRAPLGPGPARMNRVVVSQAAAGLAGYLRSQQLAGGRVLIGFDARYNSDIFARDTAEIMAGNGFEAMVVGEPTPTPVIAFGIRHYGCVAAVVVTASHNPPQDNGYKVYLGDGSQIIPPVDGLIAAEIARAAAGDLADIARSDRYSVLGDELLDAYLDRIASLVPATARHDLSWVYTPLHGVGAKAVAAAVRRTGFADASVVAEQVQPDPAFPTVAFPNPEEPGAIDLALAQAERIGADLVVANDPDADRCAVAVPVGPDREWRMLRGDELGALLGDDALRRGVTGTFACSVVSSSLLATMAAAYGQPFVTTLTGFKWIGRVPGLAFGYEEALGYCCDPTAVPDKDGISAVVRVLALAAELKAAGCTLSDRLDEIARTYGVHATDQLAVRVSDLALIDAAMARLRANPPTELGGEAVRVLDLSLGSADLPATDAVRLSGDRVTVVVRPSGTEPKLKCYLEARIPADQSQDLAVARVEARGRLEQVREEMALALGLG
ncbi:phospho-sugar mutase [Microlunatus panaciterrae]|uniref:Phosphomannomutase n=2 Tax=Microlunatus panaciterrae TaxID=400768 RepID=A0ABS2RL35_9ACTN|nr:phospho-sugar mutase [Microlunatus panaciterrae]MBM7799712.1 phosphomannomutase [Microlunatus panaciterrae]